MDHSRTKKGIRKNYKCLHFKGKHNGDVKHIKNWHFFKPLNCSVNALSKCLTLIDPNHFEVGHKN